MGSAQASPPVKLAPAPRKTSPARGFPTGGFFPERQKGDSGPVETAGALSNLRRRRIPATPQHHSDDVPVLTCALCRRGRRLVPGARLPSPFTDPGGGKPGFLSPLRRLADSSRTSRRRLGRGPRLSDRLQGRNPRRALAAALWASFARPRLLALRIRGQFPGL